MSSYALISEHRDRALTRRPPGPFIIWGIVFIVIPLWIISYPETTVRHNFKPFFIYASQLSSLIGFSLFSLSLILTSRLRFLEDLFGGLDKVYKMHLSMGKSAAIFLVAHPVLLALRWVPEDLTKALWYLLPLHRRVEIDLGSWALWGMLVLIIFTLVIKIPYDKWKISHKFMGFFFVLGVAHFYFQGISFSVNPGLRIYLALLSVGGISAWLYKSVFFDLVKKKSRFLVTEVRRLNANIVEIELQPKSKAEDIIPGQFYFFTFLSEDLSAESHPFTICDETEDGRIKIMVKALGDYTNLLNKIIKPGIPALLEGPYGKFNFRTTKREQVWIGGGVGIAPFLGWANYLFNNPNEYIRAKLYYCVKNVNSATHMEVFMNLEKRLPGFHVQVISEEQNGFFKAGDLPEIQKKEIFICGPKNMRKAILKQLNQLKVPKKQIHFEDFDFN
ncbi:ferredoxin reductase family protein [Salinimicrobium xinjiangense]|uniref:ferredoxin reductase family protein n=1 Tax=Salinimicrobium xinjiangense TaxID=438596 RepID=UPI000406C191|nr:ferric reductase-like transmembrane domain-containing protein [Salinimicrobium xinjiangense]